MNVRVAPGVPDHIAALAQVTALEGGGYIVVLGHDVAAGNVVKILNHEMLHIVLQEDPRTSDVSDSLDSYHVDGTEYVHVEYDAFGLPRHLKWA